MASLSKFIERMDYYCRVASVGYDWARRWNVWDGGDTDCSALVITCLREAGFDTGSAATTHNMSSELTARGWQRLWPDLSSAQPGDILLSDANHVAAVLWGEGWGATVAQASIGDTGGVYGNTPGDQTGWETNETAMYNYPWDCILRYTGPDESEEEDMTPEQAGQLQFIYDHLHWDEGTHFSHLGNLVAEMPIEYPTLDEKGKKTKHTAKLGDRLGYIDQRMHAIEANQKAIMEKLDAIAKAVK